MTTSALLLALTIVAPDSLRLGARGRDTVVTTRVEAGTAYVVADAAARALGGRVQRIPNHRYIVTVGGVLFEVADRSNFALSDGRLFPLTAPARERDGQLDLPVQFFADVAPRAGARVAWDESQHRLIPISVIPSAVASAPVRAAAPMATPERVSATPKPPPIGTRPANAPRAVATSGDRETVTSAAGGTVAARPKNARRRTIVIDAGHGGVDPGMRGWSPDRSPVREKDVTLGVALRLEQELERRGYAVVMTRRTDTLIALDDRGRIANRNKGDLFISVHVNAANPTWKNPTDARGFETYFLAEAKTEDERRVARMENEVVRFENETDAPKSDPLSFIINDMAQNEHLRESGDLAAAMQASLRRIHPGPSRGVKQAGFRVLVTAYMPAVLVEIGFGTNPSEALFIASDEGQRTLANAIADAASEYMARYEQRVGNEPSDRSRPR